MEAKRVNTKIMGGFVKSLMIGEPTTFQNLTVLPIFSEQGRSDGFSLLDDAIRTDKLIVTEVSDSGTVPELKVINHLDTDVLIIDGEELVGAKQNRIVNTTILVGKEREVVIPVSCVEQGRWNYRSKKFSSGKSNLYADLRRKKSKAVYHNLKMCASFHSNQSEIWDDISEKAAKFSVNSETHAMNDIYESHEHRIEDYGKQKKGTVLFMVFIFFFWSAFCPYNSINLICGCHCFDKGVTSVNHFPNKKYSKVWNEEEWVRIERD